MQTVTSTALPLPVAQDCAPGKETVAAMDVLFPKVGEMVGGSQREERLDVLLERMKQLGLDEADYGARIGSL